MKTDEFILKEYIGRLKRCLDRLDLKDIEKVVDIVRTAYQNNKQIFLCGNGGSAATSSHLACDLGKGLVTEGKKRVRIMSLTDNIALITAWANDTSYEHVFSEQLAHLVNMGDVLIAISASGNSKNVLQAVRLAKQTGAVTVGWSGFGGGKLSQEADVSIVVDSDEYGIVEDVHLSLGHMIKQILLSGISQKQSGGK